MHANLSPKPAMPDLKSYVKSQLARKPSVQVDWSQRRQKWLAELESLYAFVTNRLTGAGFPPDNIGFSAHRISEETLGDYTAHGLDIDLPAGGRVTFTPVASVVVGGFGRVDVKGPARQQIKLIADDAVDRHPGDETPVHARDWAWSFYVQDLDGRRLVALDDQGLATLMEAVSGMR